MHFTFGNVALINLAMVDIISKGTI